MKKLKIIGCYILIVLSILYILFSLYYFTIINLQPIGLAIPAVTFPPFATIYFSGLYINLNRGE